MNQFKSSISRRSKHLKDLAVSQALLVLFLNFLDYFIFTHYTCTHYLVPAEVRQADLLELELRTIMSPHVACWELNPGDLQE